MTAKSDGLGDVQGGEVVLKPNGTIRKREARPGDGVQNHGRGATKNVRFSQETYDWLRDLSVNSGKSIGGVAESYVETQRKHKISQVNFFLEQYNANQNPKYVLKSNPQSSTLVAEIATNGTKTIWFGLTDAFWTKDYSQDVYTYATPGEKHVPTPQGPINGTYMSMDDNLTMNFVRNMQVELSDRVYKPFFDEYGPGFLLVSIHSPFFNHKSVESIQSYLCDWTGGLGYFQKVYLPYDSKLIPIMSEK